MPETGGSAVRPVSPSGGHPPASNAMAFGFASLTGFASASGHSMQEHTHRHALPLGHHDAHKAHDVRRHPGRRFARVGHLPWLPVPRSAAPSYRH